MHPRSAGQFAAYHAVLKQAVKAGLLARFASRALGGVAASAALPCAGPRTSPGTWPCGLRWRDIDLDGACIRIRRNAGATGLLWTVVGAPGPLTCAVRLARTRDGQIAVLTRRGMEE
jgi:hypothetical protein